jgi:uncharacterized membrane protein YvbJ
MARKVTKVVDTTVPTDNYEKQIKQLLEKGKKDKKIDQRDIFAVIPDTPDNIDVLDQLYADLTDASVEVIQAMKKLRKKPCLRTLVILTTSPTIQCACICVKLVKSRCFPRKKS